MENMLCDEILLINEASVEHYFINRLVSRLGYKDNQILTKPSIDEIKISSGSKKKWYRPDYVLTRDDGSMWILEAKSPKEINLGNHIGQAASYCLAINGKYKRDNPTEFFVISNGFKTCLYKWDYHNEPLLELDFEDFFENNLKFYQFKKLLSPNPNKLNVEIDPLCGSSGMLATASAYIKSQGKGVDYSNINYTDWILAKKIKSIKEIEKRRESLISTENMIDIAITELRFNSPLVKALEEFSDSDKYEYNFQKNQTVIEDFLKDCSILLKSGGLLVGTFDKTFIEIINNNRLRDSILKDFNLISYSPHNIINKQYDREACIVMLEKK